MKWRNETNRWPSSLCDSKIEDMICQIDMMATLNFIKWIANKTMLIDSWAWLTLHVYVVRERTNVHWSDLWATVWLRMSEFATHFNEYSMLIPVSDFHLISLCCCERHTHTYTVTTCEPLCVLLASGKTMGHVYVARVWSFYYTNYSSFCHLLVFSAPLLFSSTTKQWFRRHIKCNIWQTHGLCLVPRIATSKSTFRHIKTISRSKRTTGSQWKMEWK